MLSKGRKSLTEYSEYLIKRDKNMSYRAKAGAGRLPIFDGHNNKNFQISTLRQMSDMRRLRVEAKE
jgi:hypothetical protein